MYGPAIVPWCLSLRPACGRPRGTAGGAFEAWAGSVGSGGRPRRRRRQAGAGPVAAARRRGRADRWPAVSPSAPHRGVDGRAGGQCDVQVGLQGGRTCRGSACPMRAEGPAASGTRCPGLEAGAGRVGSGGRPRRRRRQRARVSEAGAGRRVRAGRWPVASRRVPH